MFLLDLRRFSFGFESSADDFLCLARVVVPWLASVDLESSNSVSVSGGLARWTSVSVEGTRFSFMIGEAFVFVESSFWHSVSGDATTGSLFSVLAVHSASTAIEVSSHVFNFVGALSSAFTNGMAFSEAAM